MAGLSRSRVAAAAALLLLLFAARQLDAARRNSLTFDEPHYIGKGLVLWETGDYHFATSLSLHPPLTYHLASLPLLALDLPEVSTNERLIHGPDPPAYTVRLASRLPFVLLSVWGALLVLLWAREAAGDAAGLLALFLYTFSPTLLGFGALVHSDATVTVFYLQTLYACWRFTERPTRARLLVCSVSLGLALASKLSAILLLAILPLLLLARAFGRLDPSGSAVRPAPLHCWLWALGVSAALALPAIAVVWLSYGGSFAAVDNPGGAFPDVRLPGYLRSLLVDDQINDTGRDTYFLGEFSKEGRWYFFPVAFALKTPLGLIALLGLALFAPAAPRRRLARFMAVPFAVYLGFACFYLHVHLGVRYLLPLYPLLFVFVATQLAPIAGAARRGAVAICCAWIAVAGFVVHPHYIPYFNELAGGPARGDRLLLDSNFDWGQDLGTLARTLSERGNPEVHLAYFGPERPATYGIRSVPLRGCRPVKGVVAISANVRRGLYAAHNPLARPRRGCYDWLDAYEPIARPGYSIDVYEVP